MDDLDFVITAFTPTVTDSDDLDVVITASAPTVTDSDDAFPAADAILSRLDFRHLQRQIRTTRSRKSSLGLVLVP